MRDLNFNKALVFIPISILVAACTSTPQEPPTHHWQAESAKTDRDYRIDNQACQQQFGMDENTPAVLESDSFEAYRSCMVAKGYVLRSY